MFAQKTSIFAQKTFLAGVVEADPLVPVEMQLSIDMDLNSLPPGSPERDAFELKCEPRCACGTLAPWVRTCAWNSRWQGHRQHPPALRSRCDGCARHSRKRGKICVVRMTLCPSTGRRAWQCGHCGPGIGGTPPIPFVVAGI